MTMETRESEDCQMESQGHTVVHLHEKQYDFGVLQHFSSNGDAWDTLTNEDG